MWIKDIVFSVTMAFHGMLWIKGKDILKTYRRGSCYLSSMILSKKFVPCVALIATKEVSSPSTETFFSDFILLVFFPILIITSLPASVCGPFCFFYYFFLLFNFCLFQPCTLTLSRTPCANATNLRDKAEAILLLTVSGEPWQKSISYHWQGQRITWEILWLSKLTGFFSSFSDNI